MNKDLIETAIHKAGLLQSELKNQQTRNVLDLFGLNSPYVQCLLYNLCDTLPSVDALELGVFRGKTLVAIALHPNVKRVDAIDNFSYNYGEENKPEGHENVQITLNDNIKQYGVQNKVHIHKTDFNSIDAKTLGKSINLVHLDAVLPPKLYSNALELIKPALDTEVLWVLSNYRDLSVKLALDPFIVRSNLKVMYEKELTSTFSTDDRGWWNGVKVISTQK